MWGIGAKMNPACKALKTTKIVHVLRVRSALAPPLASTILSKIEKNIAEKKSKKKRKRKEKCKNVCGQNTHHDL